jgi:hypothetical protein
MTTGFCEHCQHCKYVTQEEVSLHDLECVLWYNLQSTWTKHFSAKPLWNTVYSIAGGIVLADSCSECGRRDDVPLIKNPMYQQSIELQCTPASIGALLREYLNQVLDLLGTFSSKRNDKVFVVLPLSTTCNNEFYVCKPRCKYKSDIETKHPWLKLLQGWEDDFVPLTRSVLGVSPGQSPIAEMKCVRDRYSALKEALRSQPDAIKKEIMLLLT